MKRQINKLCLLVVSILAAFSASAYDFEVDGIYYNKTSDNTCSVTYKTRSISSYSESVNIPEQITYSGVGYSVTEIGDSAFYECTRLTEVTIPNTVTKIDNYAFYYAYKLTSIKIPNSVTTIGKNAFEKCKGLTDMTIPNSVTSIGEFAFQNCNSLTSMVIPNSVTELDNGVFSGCSSLIEVNIPNSITDIKRAAFNGCSSLTSVSIPNSVTSIGSYAFKDCSGLTSVDIGNSVTSIGWYAFESCNGLTSVSIPNSVISIGSYAFKDCSGLTSVAIGNSVTTIGSSTFYGCSSLTSMTIPNSVTSIGDSAFYGCSSLTSVTIPDSVTSIGDSAFYKCSSLTSVTIPDSVTWIRSSTFYGCSGLTELTIPGSVTSIGDYAFEYCGITSELNFKDSETILSIGKNAFSSVASATVFLGRDINDNIFESNKKLVNLTIGDKVTSIAESEFSGCSGLTSVTIGNSVTSIGEYAFSNCKSLASVSIPNSVTKIGNSAFWGCSALTEITIPDSVTSIGNGAFRECSGLTSVSIPNSVTKIGDSAFCLCTGLKDVTIGNSVGEIGKFAFNNCKSLKWVVSRAINPPVLASYISNSSEIPLIAASNSYKSADNWKQFKVIVVQSAPTGTTFEVDGLKYEIISINDLTCRLYEIDDAIVGENIVIPEKVEYKNRIFTITEITGLINGNGDVNSITIPNYGYTISDGIIFNSALKELNIETPITSDYLILASTIDELVISPKVSDFNYNFWYNTIGKITIEDSKTSLATKKFECTGVKDVYLGRNVSASTFKGMTSLENVFISDNVTSIGEDTFDGCSGLTSIEIPNTVTSIGWGAFSGCSGLTTLEIPNSVTSIDAWAFSNCTGLTDVAFEDGALGLSIGYNAFISTSPTKAYFGRQMDFSRVSCSAMETVEFGKFVTSIADGSFKDGSNIRTVNVYNTIPPTTDDTFSNDTYLDGVLYVPESAINDYAAAPGWKNFWEIKALDNYDAVNGVYTDDSTSFSVSDGVLHIVGDASVRVVAINGAVIYSGNGDNDINLNKGMYIVVIGDKASKIVVR
jgi:hypothetical protein